MGWVTLSFKSRNLLAEQQRIEGELSKMDFDLRLLQSEMETFTQVGPKYHCCHSGMSSPYMSAKMQTDAFIKQNAYFDPKTNQYYTFSNKKPVKFNPQEYFLNIMKAETKKYMEQMMRFMRDKENAIVLKKQQLELKLQMLKAQKQQVDGAKKEAIQENVPKFA